MRRLSALARCASLVALVGASLIAADSVGAAPLANTAAADTAPIPPGTADPWNDPAHHSAFEQLASSIASTIAGRSAVVRCEDDAAWKALTVSEEDPSGLTGFVREPSHSTTTKVTRYRLVWAFRVVHGKRQRYKRKVPYTAVVTHADTFTASADTIELPPRTCGTLQTFAQQSTKPTKCSPNGAPVPCFLGTPTTSFPGICTDATLSTCYATANDWSEDYYRAYHEFAIALLTLAHESIHVVQATRGNVVPEDALVEAQAECSGMEWMPQVAVLLGDTPDDAQMIADYFWLLVYPGKASLTTAYAVQHPYWSAECKPGGALDTRPAGSTAWP